MLFFFGYYDLRISFSPPKIGGVRGGISDGNHLKKKLIRFTLTPPNLPYARGGIKCVSPSYIGFTHSVFHSPSRTGVRLGEVE